MWVDHGVGGGGWGRTSEDREVNVMGDSYGDSRWGINEGVDVKVSEC